MRWSALLILFAGAAVVAAPQAPPQQKAPTQAAPAEPTERRQHNYIYDVNGRPVPAYPTVQERRLGPGAGAPVEREEYFRGADGRPVPARSAGERVLSETNGEKTSERLIQRYDPTGRPTSKQLLKTEQRKQPDGSIVSTQTLYERDVNGRMQFTERRTTTERKTSAGGDATMIVERQGINGGIEVMERVDRTDTKRGDAVTESVSSRKLLDPNGRLTEREREFSVETKSGDATSKETKQWQMGATGQMEFVSRSLSHMVQRPDGSEVEDTEVYATKIAGTTPDLNRPQEPSLEQKVRREKKVQAGGKTIETTTERLRQVADPSRLGGLIVTEQVSTPTAEGKTIQTTVSQRDFNGKMVPIRSEVAQEKQ